MIPLSANGVILRTRLLTETSLIVHWLTEEQGRIATVAKGALRTQSPFRGKLDLFYHAEFTFHRSRRSDLHTLHEVRLLNAHAELRNDFAKLTQAAYLVHLLELATETDTPLPHLRQLLLDALRQVSAQPRSAIPVLAFEARLLQHLGLMPEVESTPLSPGARMIGRQLASGPWDSLPALRLSARQHHELVRWQGQLILAHAGRLPATRSAALQGPSDSPA